MKPSWISYTGGEQIALVLVLAAVTVLAAVVAMRLHRPIPGPSAGGALVAILVIAWLLAIVTFLVDLVVYGVQASQVHLTLPSPPNHVTPVTFICAALTFVAVVASTPARIRTRLGNAVLCACVAPMLFELPFDLIVIARTAAIPPAPVLYRLLFFLPLFAIELLTVALAATRPGARATRWTAGWLAGMFGVFALWALLGFPYPFGGLPLAANIVAKVLAFAAALSVFVRRDSFRASAVRDVTR